MVKARDVLIALWKKNNKNWEDTYKALQKKDYDLEEFEDTSDNDKYVTILDSEYPQVLKERYKPPFVLTKEELESKSYEQFTYIVKVIKTNFQDVEEEVFASNTYEARGNVDEKTACVNALNIAYHGCIDE